MKKKDDVPALIIAALNKLGPAAPRAILDEVGGSERKVGYHLRKMLAARALKASGTSMDRIYALPGQRIPGARTSAHVEPRATLGTVMTLHEPLAARTADGRIVLIHADGPGVPTVLGAEFAGPLAELLKAA